ncbi:MAG: sulfatase [Spirochaetaceae bacterium]
MDLTVKKEYRDFTIFLNRYKRTMGSIILGLGLLSCTSGDLETEVLQSRPNVVFITADDLGWKDIGCYGNQDISTPNIDALAENGTMFENAFVAAPSCSPSRASFITGQYPHTNGVTALTHRFPDKALKKTAITMPKELENAGYSTAIDGKWHPAVFTPVRSFGYQKRMTGFGIFASSWKIPNAKDAVRFIRKNKEKPFYLEMNFIQNHRIDHGKFYYSEDFFVDPNSITIPEQYALPDWPEIREDLSKYYSQTMEMDKIIGDVVDELESLGLRENTMIIFVSDNGQPYPGAKMTLYDRGIAVPLIVNWPEVVKSGAVIDDLISSIDIMPTVLEASGLEIPDTIEGISFYPQLIGDEDKTERDAVYSEMNYHVKYIPGRSVRTKEWKYIKNYSDIAFGLDELDTTDWAYRLAEEPNQPWTKPRVQEELYYLTNDPNEQINLIDNPEYAEDLERLKKMLLDNMNFTNDPYLDQVFTYDYNEDDYIKKVK